MAANAEIAGNAATVLMDRHIAGNNGDKPALKYGDKHYSYNDLAALSNRAGNVLRRVGVQPGEPVLVALNPSPALLATVIGAMKIGAIPTVAQPGRLEEQAAALEKLQPSAIVVDATARQAIGPARAESVLVVGGTEADGQSFVELLRESPSSLASAPVDGASPALNILSARESPPLTHQAVGGEDLAGAMQEFPDLARSLRAFAAGKEAVIRRPE